MHVGQMLAELQMRDDCWIQASFATSLHARQRRSFPVLVLVLLARIFIARTAAAAVAPAEGIHRMSDQMPPREHDMMTGQQIEDRSLDRATPSRRALLRPKLA